MIFSFLNYISSKYSIFNKPISQDNKLERSLDIFPKRPYGADTSNIATSYARLFSSEDGKRVLDHLQSTTLYKAYGPDVKSDTMHHLEGQRFMVAHILRLIERGRSNS